MTSTFEKSCKHWSSQKKIEMEKFYTMAKIDYKLLSEFINWPLWFKNIVECNKKNKIELLDVACGSGQFPSALIKYSSISKDFSNQINYSLLDPSSFSLFEAKKVLKPPFFIHESFETTLQDFEVEGKLYDVIWAIHALYAIPKEELKIALKKLLFCLKGKGFIAHSTINSHYIRFYEIYNKGFKNSEVVPFTCASDIANALNELNVEYNFQTLNYNNSAHVKEEYLVENFLQRCAFDDKYSLNEMRNNEIIGNYLKKLIKNDQWFFPQEVQLFFINK